MPKETSQRPQKCRALALWLGVCLLLISGFPPCAGAMEGEASPQEQSATLSGGLDTLFARYKTMGASVAVIQNGEIVFTYAYGQRVKASGGTPGAPVTTETLFQVGSISKMVAGIGLMTLVEDELAELDSELSGLLGFPVKHPRYPNVPITLRQLMTHTAALRDSGDYNLAIQGEPPSLAEMLGGSGANASFLGATRPGTRANYSNFGGGIAGSIIEALSGKTLDDYMKERVFEPLGITAGYQAKGLPEAMELADMYSMPRGRLTKALLEDSTHILSPNPDRNYFLTAGKLIISAPDLAKLLAVLCDGGFYKGVSVLRSESVAEMRTLQNGRGSVSGDSERGLFMNIIENSVVEGRVMYGHGGKAYGMLCSAYFDPLTRTGVIMLTNGCNNRKSYYDVGMLSRRVTSLCYHTLFAEDEKVESLWLVKE